MRRNQVRKLVRLRRSLILVAIGAAITAPCFGETPEQAGAKSTEHQSTATERDHQAEKEQLEPLPSPQVQIKHDPTVPGTETVQVDNPSDNESLDGKEVARTESEENSKSTLKIRPVAGPLFGRGNSNRPLIRLFGAKPKEEDESKKVLPGPPLPRPKPLNHPHIIHRTKQQKATVSGDGWVARGTTAKPPKLAAPKTPQPTAQSPSPHEQVTRSAPILKKQILKPRIEIAPKPAELSLQAPEVGRPKSPALQSLQQNLPKEMPRSVINSLGKPKPTLAPSKLPSVKQRATDRGSVGAQPKPAKVQPKPAQNQFPKIADQIREDAKLQRKVQSSTSGERIAKRTKLGAYASVGDIGANAQINELDYTGYPGKPFKVQDHVWRLKPSIERILQYFYDRPEIADGRSNWGMMHAMMVYGVDTRVSARSKQFSTIAWVAGNNICRGQRIFTHDRYGIRAKTGVGLQGHQAQLLAVLSLCDVPSNYPLYAGEKKFSVKDLIRREQLDCKAGEELTFTLIGLSHYLDTNAAWRSKDGQTWNFERLIREELSQPIVGTACGGTHRLMGFAHALRKRRSEGKPITGQWARAEYFLADFITYTYQLQNRDGSMSTEWFEGRADNGDVDRKIQTTGHMVEFLLTVTPDSSLQDPRLYRSIRYLTSALGRNLGHDWKIGPKGHALRTLAMYYERVYQSGVPWKRRAFANSSKTITR